jgi:hypothetical protein
VLKLCGLMCKSKADFAELLFPWIVYDIIVSENSKLCKLLSEKFQLHLLSESNKNREAIQLTLSTLNFLRKQWATEKGKEGKRFENTLKYV